MRVSEQQRFWSTGQRIDRAKTDNLEALSKLSSQKKINALHDDPVGAEQAIKIKSEMKEVDSFQKNVSFSKGFLDTAETSLSAIHGGLTRAHELSIAMANDSNGAASRASTAREIRQIMNEIMQLANSKYAGKYVFSGFRTQSPTLGEDGSFLGDDGEIFLQVESGNFKKINISGRELFTASSEEAEKGHVGMVESMQLLVSGLENNEKNTIFKAIDEIEYQVDKTSNIHASVGAVWTAVSDVQKRVELKKEQAATALSQIEDADLYQATSDFKRTESVLNSTLIASNKLLEPSLINFIK